MEFLYRPEFDITANELGESNKGKHVRLQSTELTRQLDTIKLKALLHIQNLLKRMALISGTASSGGNWNREL